jgi:hypothetical protein
MIALLVLASGLGVAPPARAGTITGQVQSAGTPVVGAFVAASGLDGSAAGVAGVDGYYSLTVPDGAYQVTANSPGYQPVSAGGVSVGRAPATAMLSLTPSDNPLLPVPVYGGGSLVAADGTPGVFYIAGASPGQLYRSVDDGGTWTQVDLAADDPVAGLPSTGYVTDLVTSGVGGEVAVVLSSGEVYYSVDYGATWAIVSGVPAGVNAGYGDLTWGHADGRSVLLYTAAAGPTYFADMTSLLPSFTEMTTPYAGAGGPYAVADTASGPWVATLDDAGTVRLYPLEATATAPAAAETVTGFTSANGGSVGIGGDPSAPGPPAAIVVDQQYEVSASVRPSASGSYPTPVSKQVDGDNCLSHPADSTLGVSSLAAQVTPDSGNGYAAAWFNGCWVQDVDGHLSAPVYAGGYEAAIDRGFNATAGSPGTDAVMLLAPLPGEGSTDLGVEKVAGTSTGNPVPPTDPTSPATSGTAAASAGLAETGITAAITLASASGPAPTDTATATDVGGVASDNGGLTFERATEDYSGSVAWWPGASGDWLMFGTAVSSTDGDMAAAFEDWSPSTAVSDGGNVAGSSAPDLALGGVPGSRDFIDAIAGVPGADTAFVGGTEDVSCQGAEGCTDGTVWRENLNSGPAFTGGVQIGAGQITKPGPLDYCPAQGSAGSLADVLVVVAEDGFGGGIFRVTGATGADPQATEIMSLPGYGDGAPALSVDCATGAVVATSGATGSGVLVSNDGGHSFSQMAVPEPGGGIITLRAVTLEAGTTIIVGDADGYIQSSSDGGLTWAVVNNPATGVNLSLSASAQVGITDLLSAPGITAGARRADAELSTARDVVDGPGEFAGSFEATPAPAAPQVSGFAFSPRSFVVGAGAPVKIKRARVARGTKIDFILSDPGTVAVALYRAETGRSTKAGCVAARGTVAERQRCTRYVYSRDLLQRDAAGAHTIAFSGRIGPAALAAGSYRAALFFETPIGRAAALRTTSFTVVALPKAK